MFVLDFLIINIGNISNFFLCTVLLMLIKNYMIYYIVYYIKSDPGSRFVSLDL